MGEDEKKNYRLHLINTIDNAIDNGISVYDLNVVNKKAIRHNYINKQVVIDKIEELKLSGGSDGKDNVENLARELIIENLQELLEGERK